MSNADAVLLEFDQAIQAYVADCHSAPVLWHRPDVAEFTRLRSLLTECAENGSARCQYALATILWIGLCCETEQQYRESHDTAIHEATHWWIAAASQGHWPALDNLVTSGVGPEAERARKAWHELEKERQDLIGRSHGMPVYGPSFVRELSLRLYSKADPTIL